VDISYELIKCKCTCTQGTDQVRLGTDFEVDTSGSALGVVDSLGTGLDVAVRTVDRRQIPLIGVFAPFAIGVWILPVDAVVVAGRVGGQVAQGVDGDAVVGSRVSDGTGVPGDGTGENVVGSFSTDEGAGTTQNGIGGEGGSLIKERSADISLSNVTTCRYENRVRSDLEEVNGGPGVNAGLLVDGSHKGALLVLGRVEGGQEVQLETTGDLVLELDLSSEDVRGGPSLGDGDTVLGVDPLSLDVTGDSGRLGITKPSDLEAGGERGGLDLERRAVDRVLLKAAERVLARIGFDIHCRSLTSLLNRSDELMRFAYQVWSGE
jgi:hypothetical protein